MKIRQQEGLVATINIAPFDDSAVCRQLRDRLFAEATIASECPPRERLDDFDESIIVFDSCSQGLNFLSSFLRSASSLDKMSEDVHLHAGMCVGNYFMNQDQIYGEAVNLATKLALSSRKNELLLVGISSEIIESHLEKHQDLISYSRCDEGNCVSLGSIDRDSTLVKFAEQILHIEFDHKEREFNPARCQKIEIGRSETSNIQMGYDQISRHHATIKLLYDDIHIEDHSSNGTYVYFDDREIFLSNNSIRVGKSGFICCGLSKADSRDDNNIIAYGMQDRERSAA